MAFPEPVKSGLTPEEYFALDEQEGVRYDYWDGEVFAMDWQMMSGGSVNHVVISSNTQFAFASRLRPRNCLVLNSDLRVQLVEGTRYVHPDVAIVCADPEGTNLVVTNPILVVEVLSDSTESYDRGQKFEHYRRIPSIKAVMLMEQERPHVELFERQGDGFWKLTEATGLDQNITIDTLDLDLPLTEFYAQVDFTA